MLGKLGRWSQFLQNFKFDTVHVSGKNYAGADALSRVYESNDDAHEILMSSVSDCFAISEINDDSSPPNDSFLKIT